MITKNKNIFLANNDMNSFELFEERKEYKLFVSIQHSIDAWYKNPLYGKVDYARNPVTLSESNLKQLPTNGSTLFAIDFVVDLFKQMKNFYSQATLQKRVVPQGSLITSLEPKKAWVSVNNLYHSHMQMIYNLFVASYLISAKKEKNINNFVDFMKEFLKFATLQNNVPYTKSGFMMSYFCSVLVSGLVIELNIDGNYPNDKMKQKFMEDVNFSYYKHTVKKYGFLIDKNIPWRLYANLNSNRVREYARKYGLENNTSFLKDFYDSYYYDLTLQDVNIFRTYMIHFYNSFVTAYPNIRKENCKKGDTIYGTSKRQKITPESTNSELYWLKIYVLIRLLESNRVFDENQKENIVKRVVDMYIFVDIITALSYLNREIEKKEP